MSTFVSLLQGECNRCGLCCAGTWNGRPWRCANLKMVGPMGEPYATMCEVYTERYDAMPITGVDMETGAVIGWGHCYLNSRTEDLAIIQKGVGKGCSLTLKRAIRPLGETQDY